MTAREKAEKIKEAWRPYHQGRCYVFSAAAGKRPPCDCVLCLADELAARIETLEKEEEKWRALCQEALNALDCECDLCTILKERLRRAVEKGIASEPTESD